MATVIMNIFTKEFTKENKDVHACTCLLQDADMSSNENDDLENVLPSVKKKKKKGKSLLQKV